MTTHCRSDSRLEPAPREHASPSACWLLTLPFAFGLALAACNESSPEGGDDDSAGAGGNDEGGESGGGAGEAGGAGGEGGSTETPDAAAGGSGGGLGAGGSANMPDAGMMADSALAVPERIWFSRTLTWNVGAQPDINESQVIADWVRPINYVASNIHMRVVTTQVGSMPAFYELCIVDKRGPDHFICFRCPDGGISETGEQLCSIKPTACSGAGLGENSSCYGGNYMFGQRPTRTWHRLRSEVNNGSNGAPNLGCQGPACGAELSYLNAGSLPFSAKVTVVLVPRDQAFSGWNKYPVP